MPIEFGTDCCVSSALIARRPNADWLSYNGDFSGRSIQRAFPINLSNVGQLRARWVFRSSNSNRLELRRGGERGDVCNVGQRYLRSGRPNSAGQSGITYGLFPKNFIDDASGHPTAVLRCGMLASYRLTDNAHLLCLDARSGSLLWDVAYADWKRK